MLKRSVIIMTVAALVLCFLALPTTIRAADAFEVSAVDVSPFSAGDSLTIRVAISNITIDKLAGVDLEASYDSTLLEPDGLDGASVKNWNASKGALDEAGETDWDFSGRVEADDAKIFMYFTEENTKGMNDADKLYVDMQFKALADGAVGAELISIEATGADGDTLAMVAGTGCNIKVAEAEEPDDATDGPMETPPVPDGDAYTVVAEDVTEYKAGEDVKIRFTVDEISSSDPIKEFRLGIAVNGAKLKVKGAPEESRPGCF